MTNPDDTIHRVYFGVAAFRAQTDLKHLKLSNIHLPDKRSMDFPQIAA